MKKILTSLAVAGLALGALAACEEKKPDNVPAATKKAVDATKDAAKDVKNTATDAAKDVKDATKPAN